MEYRTWPMTASVSPMTDSTIEQQPRGMAELQRARLLGGRHYGIQK
jgi:hypothetical protein